MSNHEQSKASLFAFIFALLGFLAVSGAMIAPFFLALTMGGILALLAWPLQKALSSITHCRRLTAFLITCLMLLLVIVPILTFTTLAVRQAVHVADALAQSEQVSLEFLNRALQQIPFFNQLWRQFDFEKNLATGLEAFGEGATRFVLGIAKGIPQGSVQMILICLTCYFMLVDGSNFLNWLYARLPLAKDVRDRVTQVFHETSISVIWASMAAALTQAIIIFISFLILEVPAAFLAGGLTFIFAFIPLAGSVPVWLSGALYLYIKDDYLGFFSMVAFGLVTSSIDNLIRPWILKGRSEMHPLVSLVSIFGGIQMFGLYGVFLGPILIAIFISLLQLWPLIGQRFGLVFDTGYEDTFSHVEFEKSKSIKLNAKDK